MPKAFLKIFFYSLILVVTLLFVPTVFAAYEKFSSGDAVTISEFVYNDDFTPYTSNCTLLVYKPNGDPFILPGGVIMDRDDATGRHYKIFTPDSAEGVWPATMSCGTPGVDLSILDKTFIVGYSDASTTAISNAVWNNTNKTLTSFGTLVNDVASSVWSNVARTLTSRQIGAGEYISGVSSEYLVTQVASQEQASSTQADIAAIKNDVASILGQTGNISAIKTKTDTILWTDITGLVTSNGQIKAKTDTIDWTNVTAIKTKTDTIAWDDVTGVKAKTDTILWTDVTTIKNNAATLITEIGTGNISAIKTKTDTILWTDITGLVTSNGQIKAKTDTIDWTNVTAIKTKTDTIAWDDVTGVKAKTDTILWTDVTTIKSSQEAGWTVIMSNADRVLAGKTYRAKIYLTNYKSIPTNSLTAPKITLYDADRNLVVSDITMTNLSTGVYEYTYSIPAAAAQGLWESTVSTEVELDKIIQTNDYWTVEGSPAQVIINSITDDTIPSISANMTVTNEGLTGYEYHYQWCVVASSDNSCGGGDDVYYASASKYINAGEDWNTNLSVTVPTAGNYFFKLVVYYGVEQSGASRYFSALTPPAGPTCGDGSCDSPETCSSCPTDCGQCGGGGGGGGGTTPPPITTTCNGADFNHDKQVNSIDFSILLAFWKTAWPFKNPCVDINNDKQVNSTDFSILMYQWGTKK